MLIIKVRNLHMQSLHFVCHWATFQALDGKKTVSSIQVICKLKAQQNIFL